MNQPSRLFVDVSVIARRDAGTGIQRVVRAIWNELANVADPLLEIVPVAGAAGGQYRCIRPDFLKNPHKRLPLPIGRNRIRARSGDVFLGLDLASHILPRNSAQLAAWKHSGVKVAVLVYDLLPVRRPEWFSEKSQAHYARWLDFVSVQADQLLCISRHVANDLSAWVADRGIAVGPHSKISQIRMGEQFMAHAPSMGLPANAQPVLEWVRAGRTILMVGTIEPRKGHTQAVAAFEKLWTEQAGTGWQLLIVGRPGWQTDELQRRLLEHPLRGTRILWISDATDEFLEQLYAACTGLLMPSLGEGYGLPLLEAATHAKPILARDLPVFREVAPVGTSFFTGESAVDLAEALSAWPMAPVHSGTGEKSASWSGTVEDILGAISASA